MTGRSGAADRLDGILGADTSGAAEYPRS